MMSRVTIAALVAILGSIATAFIPVTVYIGNSFWNSPQFVFLRIGLIVLIGSLLWYWEHAYSGATILWPKRWKSIIMLFGTESLLVYTVHLIIVYGHNFSWSFITMFGPNLSYGYCFLLSGMLAAAMYLLAYSWSSIKTWNINYAKILQYAIIVIISARFILAD